ncbi:ABC transporter permease [bacterium]|nr:ABC transporter permease [bacterium]
MDFLSQMSLAFKSFLDHKLRTALTLLGMIFGVGAVIAMLSIGEGAEHEALEMIDAMGLRNIIVRIREFDDDKLLEIREKSLGLTLRDLESVRETLPFLSTHSALKEVSCYQIFSPWGKSDARTYGVSPSHRTMANLELQAGRFLVDYDNRILAPVCVIGSRVAYDLFQNRDPIGQEIKINQLWFTVVGLLRDRTMNKNEFEGVKISSVQNQIFLPLETALKSFSFTPLADEIDEFRIQISPGYSSSSAAQTLDHLLEVRHKNARDFEIIVPEKLLEQHRQTQRIFTIVMACVAGISLLVGGIGIMNIMLATVLERTMEIGLRRAVGARQKDIRSQFILETFSISAVGGLIGIVFGFSLALIIVRFSGWRMGWSIEAIALSLGVCASVGLLFGIYPAIKASRLDPIVALRHE